MTADETPARRASTPEGTPEVVDADAAVGARPVPGEMMSFSFRSSPYPTPQDLREYEEIHPGFTDRMLTLTERETDHRIREESLQNRATQVLAMVISEAWYNGHQATDAGRGGPAHTPSVSPHKGARMRPKKTSPYYKLRPLPPE